jgi:hypothetical protein
MLQLRRGLFAAPLAFTPTPLRDGLDRVVVAGRCAALQEGLGAADVVRPLLFDRYAARYATLDALLSSSGCRLKNLRKAWRASVTPNDRLDELCRISQTAGACDAFRMFGWVPFSRHAIGEVLLTTSSNDWLQTYRSTSPMN